MHSEPSIAGPAAPAAVAAAPRQAAYPGATARHGARPLADADWLWGAVAVGGSLLALLATLWSGWIPHDEGQLGQSAERVLQGELPHRDFQEMYSGLLTYWHAAAFQVLGIRMPSLRYAMLPLALTFSLLFYLIARRFVSPPLAALVTVVSVSASISIHPTALPTWYLLYFSTLGLWAHLRELETGRRRWLLLAGVAAGIAMTIKITGLYSIAAGLLIITAFRPRLTVGPPAGMQPADARWHRAWLWATAVVGTAAVAWLLTRQDRGIDTLLYLALPPAAACLALPKIAERWSEVGGGSQLRQLAGRYVLLLLGAAAPITAFLWNWWRAGAIDSLIEGVFILPQMRFLDFFKPTVPWGQSLLAVPLLMISLPGRWLDRKWVAVPVTAIAIAMLVRGATTDYLHFTGCMWGFGLWRWWLPEASVFLLLALYRRNSEWRLSPADYAVLCFSGFFWINQHPFSHVLYLLFGTPFVLLALAGCIQKRKHRRGAWIVTALIGGFAAWRYFPDATFREGPPLGTVTRTVNVPRGGLSIDSSEAEAIEAIVSIVNLYSQPGSAVLAGADCPEIAFLTGRRNPTPTMYDLFDREPNREQRLLRLVDEQRIPVTVVKLLPDFSPPWPVPMVKELIKRYTYARRCGRYVVLYGLTQQDDATTGASAE